MIQIDYNLLNNIYQLNPIANLVFKTIDKQYIDSYINKAKLIGYEGVKLNGIYILYNNKDTLVISMDNFEMVENIDSLFSDRNFTSINITEVSTSKVINFKNTFHNCKAKLIDLHNLDTSKALSMEGMFSYCKNLKKLNIRSFDTWLVTSMKKMFEGVYLDELNISNFNTYRVCSTVKMFKDSKIKHLKLGCKNFGYNIGSMESMFENSEIECIDLSETTIRDSDKVLLYNMFYNCKANLKLPKDIPSAKRILNELSLSEHNVTIIE